MCDMAINIKALQAKSGLLKGKLLIHSVEVEDFSKRKTFDISMLQPGYLSRNQPPLKSTLPETTTIATVTTSGPPLLLQQQQQQQQHLQHLLQYKQVLEEFKNYVKVA